MKVKRFLLLLSIALCVAAVSALPGLKSKGQEAAPSNNKKQSPAEADSGQEPIADYLAAEPSDPDQRAKRSARGKKYNEVSVPIDPASDGLVATINSHWDMNLPPLPVGQSNLIVTGTVTDAQAFLSPNKASVYSEFVLSVEKVWKNDTAKSLAPGEQITVERQGGRVRNPGGGMQRHVVAGQGLPRNGRRYLFFLSRNGLENDYFHILTAYELGRGQAFPLDNVRRFKAYEGRDEAVFLKEIQSAIDSSSSN